MCTMYASVDVKLASSSSYLLFSISLPLFVLLIQFYLSAYIALVLVLFLFLSPG